MLLLPRLDANALLHEGAVQVSAGAFPYEQLCDENRRRGRTDPEFELTDTGIFDDHRYFDVTVEYAKATANDILIRIEVANRGPERARIHVLPTLWFRNTWSWGRSGEGYWPRPHISRARDYGVRAEHVTLGTLELRGDASGERRTRAARH